MRTSDITLYDLLMQRTKETLIRSSRNLDLRIPTSLRKAQFARKMANSLLFNPLWILKRLPYLEVLKLQRMVHAEDHSVFIRLLFAEDCISEIGLTWYPKIEGGIKERISNDLAEVLAPVIDDFTGKLDPSSGRLHHEILLNGLLNLHGILTIYELEKLAGEICPELTGDLFKETIDRSYLLRRGMFSDGRFVYLSSRFIFEEEIMLDKIEERVSLKSARFSLAEVMAAGDLEMPMPPETPATRSFREELIRTVKDEPEVNRWISRMWILLNNDRHPGDMIGSFIEDNPMDEKESRRFIPGFINWANHSPRWVNKGNPANTTYSMKGPSQAAPSPPQFKVIPGGQLKGGGNSYGEAPPVVAPPTLSGGRKPGRNDPCPCGSGKKYKHCCGKPG